MSTSSPNSAEMPDESSPPSRSELIRNALWDGVIGFVVVWIILVIYLPIAIFKGKNPFNAKPLTPEFWVEVACISVLILAGAATLALWEYRVGVKKLRAWEHRKMWGRAPD